MAFRSYAKKTCPVTQSPQNWSESEDGNLIIVRDDHIHTNDEWVLCRETSTDGAPIYRRREEGEESRRREAYVRPEPVGPNLAPLEDRDAVYRRLLALCPLTEAHKQHLKDRRIPNLLDVLPMGSLPSAEKGGRWLIVKALRADFSDELLESVPGFYKDEQGRLLLAGSEGILVASLSADKKIQGFQIRRDKIEENKPRYTWLSAGWVDESANKRTGVGSGSPTGIILSDAWDGNVALTEGAMKGAALHHVLPNAAILYAAGVSQLSAILEAIKSLPSPPKSITLYFDADAWRKAEVFGALVRQIRALQSMPLSLFVRAWDEQIGKGIDDFLRIQVPLLYYTLEDTFPLDPKGLCDAFAAIEKKEPLHLFAESKDTALALSMGIPAVCVPAFQPTEEGLEKLTLRFKKREDKECYIAFTKKQKSSALTMARRLQGRDFDARLAPLKQVEDYAATYEIEGEHLAIMEAKESEDVRSNRGLSSVIDRVRTACVGQDMTLVARTIEVLKEYCPIVKGEVLKAVKSELKPSLLAENEAAQLFLEREAHDICYDPVTKGWMVYEGEAWRPAKEEEVSVRVARFVTAIRPKHAAGYVQGVQKMISWSLLRSDWNTKTHLIPLSNGVLDVSQHPEGVKHPATLQLKEHDSADGLTWKLPFAFDPNAECPTIRQWFADASSIMQEDGTWRESAEYQKKLIAFIAATLRGMGESLQVFFSLVGVPGTGKGTFFRLVEAFMGEQNVFVTNLASFEGSRFESAGVIGRRLLMITDSDNYRGSVEKLRALTGGDRIGVEKKGVQPDPKGCRPNLTALIASNEPIQFQGSDAMERRRVTVRFQRKVEAHKQDPNLGAKLEAELPGLLNWALSLSEAEIREALKVDGEDSKEARRQILEDRAIGMFVRQCLAVEIGARTKIGNANKTTPKEYEETGMLYRDADSQLYPAYRQFYESAYGSRTETSSIRFNRDLASFLHAALSLPPNLFYKDTKPSRDGYAWNGIVLRTSPSDTRPSPFEVSPTVGNPKLLEREAPTQKAEEASPIAEPVVESEIVSIDLLAVEMVAHDFTPTQDERSLLTFSSNQRSICSEVWKAQSVEEATHRLRPYFPAIRASFVAWVWQTHRQDYITLFAPDYAKHLPRNGSQMAEEDF